MCPGAYIYKVLRSQVLLSYEWGFYAPSYGFDHFSFKVRGTSFQGTVKIATKEFSNTFTVIFLTGAFEKEEVKRVTGVNEEDLVDVLRANIDGSDSWKHIKQEYYYQHTLYNKV